MIKKTIKSWGIRLILILYNATVLSACSHNGNGTEQSEEASILSSSRDITLEGKVAEIVQRGTLFVGTTGDYRPLSFCEPDGTYWGFGIEVANEIAKSLGVGVQFVKT